MNQPLIRDHFLTSVQVLLLRRLIDQTLEEAHGQIARSIRKGAHAHGQKEAGAERAASGGVILRRRSTKAPRLQGIASPLPALIRGIVNNLTALVRDEAAPEVTSHGFSGEVWPDAVSLYRYKSVSGNATTGEGEKTSGLLARFYPEFYPHADTSHAHRCLSASIVLTNHSTSSNTSSSSTTTTTSTSTTTSGSSLEKKGATGATLVGGDLLFRNCRGNKTCHIVDGVVPDRSLWQDDATAQFSALPVATAVRSKAGRLVLFLAENIHGVSPVIQGERDVMVVWFSCSRDHARWFMRRRRVAKRAQPFTISDRMVEVAMVQ